MKCLDDDILIIKNAACIPDSFMRVDAWATCSHMLSTCMANLPIEGLERRFEIDYFQHYK